MKGDAIVDPKTKVDHVVVDSELDSKPDPVKIEPETVVDNSEFDSMLDPVVVELEVSPVVVGKNSNCKPKPNGQAYRLKPKTKKKKGNQRHWNNNKKKIQWKDQPHITSFPDHLLQKEEVKKDIRKEMKAMYDRARIHGMEQTYGLVYYNSNGKAADDDADDDSIFHDTFQVKSASFDTDDDNDEPISYGETINNNFNTPTGFEEGATGLTIDYGSVLHAQYCHCSGDLYYRPIKIYGDNPDATDEAIEMMTNATQSWSLCDGAPPLPDHPILSLSSNKQ